MTRRRQPPAAAQLDMFAAGAHGAASRPLTPASPAPPTTAPPEETPPTAPPDAPDVTPGARWRMEHHGLWTVIRRAADGRIILRGENGFQVMTADELRARLSPVTSGG